LVHLFTGDDGESHFTDGVVDLAPVEVSDARSSVREAATLSFEESAQGSSRSWHNAPARQYVITLRGTLEFETRLGERFMLAPGDVLLAEDTTGGGHRWELVDDQPWRRVYVTVR
jgi:quercetin dioxygenase-like cupin family protein